MMRDTVNTSAVFGATIELSGSAKPISAAAGEYAMNLIVPCAPNTLTATQYRLPYNHVPKAA